MFINVRWLSFPSDVKLTVAWGRSTAIVILSVSKNAARESFKILQTINTYNYERVYVSLLFFTYFNSI